MKTFRIKVRELRHEHPQKTARKQVVTDAELHSDVNMSWKDMK